MDPPRVDATKAETQLLLLYISAAPDLELERDALGRAVTELPVDLNWRIIQSPRGNEVLDREALKRADVHLLLMGGDIRAPVGLEWLAAVRSGRRPYLLLKDAVSRTSAGAAFVRHVADMERWEPFTGPEDLRRLVLLHLSAHVLDHASELGLTAGEVDRLRRWQEELASARPGPAQTERGGAGESGLLLSLERFRPSEGIRLGHKDESA
jgi:hypothetical protein